MVDPPENGLNLLENMTNRFPHIPYFAWISHALHPKFLNPYMYVLRTNHNFVWTVDIVELKTWKWHFENKATVGWFLDWQIFQAGFFCSQSSEKKRKYDHFFLPELFWCIGRSAIQGINCLMLLLNYGWNFVCKYLWYDFVYEIRSRSTRSMKPSRKPTDNRQIPWTDNCQAVQSCERWHSIVQTDATNCTIFLLSDAWWSITCDLVPVSKW